jgi:hypothetical protein
MSAVTAREYVVVPAGSVVDGGPNPLPSKAEL